MGWLSWSRLPVIVFQDCHLISAKKNMKKTGGFQGSLSNTPKRSGNDWSRPRSCSKISWASVSVEAKECLQPKPWWPAQITNWRLESNVQTECVSTMMYAWCFVCRTDRFDKNGCQIGKNYPNFLGKHILNHTKPPIQNIRQMFFFPLCFLHMFCTVFVSWCTLTFSAHPVLSHLPLLWSPEQGCEQRLSWSHWTDWSVGGEMWPTFFPNCREKLIVLSRILRGLIVWQFNPNVPWVVKIKLFVQVTFAMPCHDEILGGFGFAFQRVSKSDCFSFRKSMFASLGEFI